MEFRVFSYYQLPIYLTHTLLHGTHRYDTHKQTHVYHVLNDVGLIFSRSYVNVKAYGLSIRIDAGPLFSLYLRHVFRDNE